MDNLVKDKDGRVVLGLSRGPAHTSQFCRYCIRLWSKTTLYKLSRERCENKMDDNEEILTAISLLTDMTNDYDIFIAVITLLVAIT